MKKLFFVATMLVMCSLSEFSILFSQSFLQAESSSGVQLTPHMLITEVYGGGGNSGAPYNLDFVELYNTTTDNISLSGWSLQYFTSAATTPSKIITFQENAVVGAQKHFLIALSGGVNGANLPGIDLSETAILSATSGKIVLFSTVESQTITDSASVALNPALIDYVPYGKAAVPVWGSAMNKDCSATLSAIRNKLPDGSYSSTKNTGYDFAAMAPSPEYSGLINATGEVEYLLPVYLNSDGFLLNITIPSNLTLFSMDGKLLFDKVMYSGELQIHLSEPGIYLLNISGKTHKLIYHP